MQTYRLAVRACATTFACCLMLALQAEVTERKSPATSASEFAFIDQAVKQHIRDGKLVGAVTWISQQGKVVHYAAHGMRDRVQAIGMQPDSIFRIHSFTKSITTAAAMMLWEAGKFKLDDPVAKYLPAFSHQKVFDTQGRQSLSRPMTIRDLMRHTSGIISPNEQGTELEKIWHEANLRSLDMPLHEFCNRVAELPLEFSPGERWKYGMSLDVLGHLIEVWSDQRFEDFLRQRIFAPLAMQDTDFFVPPEKLRRLATLYQRDEEGALQSRYGRNSQDDRFYVPQKSPRRCSAGGGLFSTAGDYGKFLQMLLAGGRHDQRQLLKPETIAMMTANQLPDHILGVQFGENIRDGFKFGLGFSVVTKSSKWGPQARIGEFGWGGAASCHYWLWPQQQLAVITLESTWPYNRNLENALKAKIYTALEQKKRTN